MESEYSPEFLRLAELTTGAPANLEDIILRLRAAREPAQDLAQRFREREGDPRTYWSEQILKQVTAWNAVIDKYLRPVEILMTPPAQLMSLGQAAHESRRAALAATFSLRQIATEGIPGLVPLLAFHARKEQPEISADLRDWVNLLVTEAEHSRQAASEQLAQLEDLLARCQKLGAEMGLGFLYDEERRIFAIGYQVAERRLDNSFYDLLASEARLTSFLAIARGEVPVEHWWALGRPFGSAYGRLPLLSWSGTMFEYLMPLLFTHTHENSLLDRACHDAVRCQMGYARETSVPWGISESAFSALDRHNVYQYRAFGVPALALKRGQDDDLVIAPYAAALALGVAPVDAVKNLRRLALLFDSELLGECGYYEAIDYSRRTEPGGAAGIIIRCYMVHHQGMSLLAYNNALHDNVMRKRFHSDLRISATEPLLHEHIPEQILPATAAEAHEERPTPRTMPVLGSAVVAQTPDIAAPRLHLLSNGACSLMITNSGGGSLRWIDLDVTRWHADSTCDVPGPTCYLRDLESGTVWSNTHQPVRSEERRYTWSFTPDKAEFRRRSGPCETGTEIVISAEDDAEIRRVTLVNTSRKESRLELTSYLELALAPHRTDRAHPAFNKLFVETEWLPQCHALIAHRRLRAPDDRPVWTGHLMVAATSFDGPIEFETDRAQFIGRDRSLERPVALFRSLTNSVGTVLDPVFSLRRRVTIAPNERFQFAIVTVVADSREAVVALIERYAEFATCARAFETAWTHSQLEMRRLHIRPADVQTFQQLAALILFPQAQLRPSPARLGRQTEGQRALWRQGISGDLPIVVVMIAHLRDVEVVREILTAHTFWNLRGLKVDLVLVSEESPSYDDPLTNHLRRLTEARAVLTGVDQPGGVYLRSASMISKEELIALQGAARMVLIAARGTLRQQLAATTPVAAKPKLLLPASTIPR